MPKFTSRKICQNCFLDITILFLTNIIYVSRHCLYPWVIHTVTHSSIFYLSAKALKKSQNQLWCFRCQLYAKIVFVRAINKSIYMYTSFYKIIGPYWRYWLDINIIGYLIIQIHILNLTMSAYVYWAKHPEKFQYCDTSEWCNHSR